MFDYLFKTELAAGDEQRILDETFKYYGENLNPGFLEFKRSAKSDAHGVEWRGEGVWMYNIHGHRFLDTPGKVRLGDRDLIGFQKRLRNVFR